MQRIIKFVDQLDDQVVDSVEHGSPRLLLCITDLRFSLFLFFNYNFVIINLRLEIYIAVLSFSSMEVIVLILKS